MKRILVTGCCGNIGANVVDLLLERGYGVRGIDLAVADRELMVMTMHTPSWMLSKVVPKFLGKQNPHRLFRPSVQMVEL